MFHLVTLHASMSLPIRCGICCAAIFVTFALRGVANSYCFTIVLRPTIQVGNQRQQHFSVFCGPRFGATNTGIDVRVRLGTANRESHWGYFETAARAPIEIRPPGWRGCGPNQVFLPLSSSHAPLHADQVTEHPTGGGIFALVLTGPAVFQS